MTYLTQKVQVPLWNLLAIMVYVIVSSVIIWL